MPEDRDDVVERWLSEAGYQPEQHALITILEHCDTIERRGWTSVSTDWLREVIASALEVEPSPPQRPEPAEPLAVPADVADVPLRRLVLRVVHPGDTVTVTEVATRLGTLSSHWSNPSVSNALGYLVARGHMVRDRKGVYTRPEAESA